MGIAIKANGWDDRLHAASVVNRALRGPVAESVGLFLVSQIAYSHEVQGRSSTDQHGIWPPRKVPSTGLIVFGIRGSVRKAIRQALLDPTAQQFAIKRSKQAPAGAQAVFSRKQVLGAKLALDAEDKRKEYKKAQQLNSARKVTEAKRALKRLHVKAVEQQNYEEAESTRQQLELIKANITKAGSYRQAATYLPRPVLLRTGNMRDSWTFRVEVIGTRVVLWIGTVVPYARHHELGEGVPVRKQVVVSDNDRRHIAEITNEIISKEFSDG